MAFWTKKEDGGEALDPEKLPQHLAIIMDGNGRWAKKRNLPRTAGHKVGAETFRSIATYCKNIGIEYLTVYAFSTENWKRPKEEVDTIMSLLERYLLEAAEKMAADKIALDFLGDISVLSPKLKKLCEDTRAIAKTYEPAIRVNICLNYGARDEIVRASILAAEKALKEGRALSSITEKDLSQQMYTAHMPDPDLVIRPSGEERISNFLLWQSAYAEFAFTDVLWPDFDEKELKKILIDYAGRQRRFGGV